MSVTKELPETATQAATHAAEYGLAAKIVAALVCQDLLKTDLVEENLAVAVAVVTNCLCGVAALDPDGFNDIVMGWCWRE